MSADDTQKPAEKPLISQSCCSKVYQRTIINSFSILKNKFFNKFLLFLIISITTWLQAYLFFGNNALPGGTIFSLIILVVCSHFVGFIFEKIKMPSLLGMLLVGIFFKNVPVLCIVGKSIDSSTSSLLRNISFCVILCRAGLGLDLNKLKKMKFLILKYSLIPCLTEALLFGVISKFILNLPFTWTILMGFVVSGVSPAVVVPLMIELQETGLGVSKNIPNLVIASSCIDNILAITGHSLMIGIVFNKGEIWWTIVQCPIQILVGLAFGIVTGFSLSLIRIDHKIKMVTLRFFVLSAVSLIALIGSKKINFPTSGPLAVLTLTIVAKQVWKNIDENIYKEEKVNDPIETDKVARNESKLTQTYTKLWILIFLPLLFALIGNEIDFNKVKLNVLAYQLGALCVGLFVRIVSTFLSVSFGDFDLKEKIFLCIAWLPKATVQAAVGSIALDFARENISTGQISMATDVLNIAVLSIIVTAPLGTLLISLTASRLLKITI